MNRWECIKKVFETSNEADKRKSEINKLNGNNKMRIYKCDNCGKYHLTSMSKHDHKFKHNSEYRSQILRNAFLSRETEYWENKLGVKE